jgi:hypothetical protein
MDIVEQLRSVTRLLRETEETSYEPDDTLASEAADKIEKLQEALQMLVNEKCDYMILNLLGDPEQQHTIKIARAALKEV